MQWLQSFGAYGDGRGDGLGFGFRVLSLGFRMALKPGL